MKDFDAAICRKEKGDSALRDDTDLEYITDKMTTRKAADTKMEVCACILLLVRWRPDTLPLSNYILCRAQNMN